jgi:AcrR family transcriptional regulator
MTSSTSSDQVRRRRRGAELESALLDAAWDELVAVGYANLTMESVAVRAQTGVAVLYRRWANKQELVIATLEHYRSSHPIDVPETGTLRGDLLATLTAMSEARGSFFAIGVATAFTGLTADTGLSPKQVRDRVLGDQQPARIRAIYQRAHDRGEIDLARIPQSVLTMPFDLVRHDLFLELKPLKTARILSIVDEIFLPLVESYSGSSPGGAQRRYRTARR